MKIYIEKLKELIKKPLFLKIAVAAGLILMAIIAVSDFSGEDNQAPEDAVSEKNAGFEEAEAYAGQLRQELMKILSSIEGAGKTDVLVTVKSTEEYVYAQTARQSANQAENGYVILDKGNSQKEALIKKVYKPEISGVVVVCEGGDDPKVCEKIYKAVSTALDIPSTKIFVAEMK